ncbi:VHS domain-containing protein [Arthroderma uncinatum]|uniref:VHS domain-containing protein n=1 Tax=Arthroderma uncinatum TaxID=74035 RepID=UPI00144A52BC|nr:VHS domain-containing protein [Arthroderma uncinatum]KAF3492401.1 VHS domain-containing protein [Arthroderma uncinatum]
MVLSWAEMLMLTHSLTAEQYEVDDWSGIINLIEVIRLQASGPSEASRALRKKLKYGNVHRQLRALTILDFLIQNAGERFLKSFADEPLLERLRVIATDPHTDQAVKDKCQQLYSQWTVSYKGVAGMERVTALYRQLPKRKKPAGEQHSKILKEPVEEPLGHSVSIVAGDGPSKALNSNSPTTSKQSRSSFISGRKFKRDMDKQTADAKDARKAEKGHAKSRTASPEDIRAIQRAVVDVGFTVSRLEDALKLVNREKQRVSEVQDVMIPVKRCKELRVELLRLLHKIDDDDYLGILIHNHEELVNALLAFEVMDKSVDDDSDSEEESAIQPSESPHRNNQTSPPAKPPRPQADPSLQDKYKDLESESEQSEDDDDIDNPFGDRNAISTPALEKPGMTWREV